MAVVHMEVGYTVAVMMAAGCKAAVIADSAGLAARKVKNQLMAVAKGDEERET